MRTIKDYFNHYAPSIRGTWTEQEYKFAQRKTKGQTASQRALSMIEVIKINR